MSRVTLVGVVLFASTLAYGQESRKFNAKTLEGTYEVPVFAPKGGVVGNEVVEASNEEEHTRSAVYYVKTDIKKVLDFYGGSMGDPKKAVDGVEDTYLFKKNDKKVGRKVRVRFDSSSHSVEITLVRKDWVSEEDVEQ